MTTEEREKTFSFDLNAFLYRGSILKNSDSVLALVVYTGTDTKQIKNFGKYRLKLPSYYKTLGLIFRYTLTLILFLTGALTMANNAWSNRHFNQHQYIYYGVDTLSLSFISVKTFFYFIVMTSMIAYNCVEIILQVSKLVYTWFIHQDAQMAIPDFIAKDILKCSVLDLDLIGDLGEIEYLLCDKTGTLTKNILEFKAVAFP